MQDKEKARLKVERNKDKIRQKTSTELYLSFNTFQGRKIILSVK